MRVCRKRSYQESFVFRPLKNCSIVYNILHLLPFRSHRIFYTKTMSNVMRPICRSILARGVNIRTTSVRKAHDVIANEKPLMDLMPVPQGPWEELHKQRQQKYNMHLIGGILFFLVSVGVAYQTGNLFLNALPPPLPEKKK